MNRDYNYENITLWDPATWADSDAPIHPQVTAILEKQYADQRDAVKSGKFAGRVGTPDPKTNVVTLDDVVAEWDAKGLEYHYAGMGFVSWLALIPHAHTRSTPLLLVFACADQKDPMWAMDTLEYYRSYNEKAAAEGFALLYIVQDSPRASGIYMDIILEVSSLWKIDMERVLLDVSALDVQPDETVFCGVRVTDATDRWIGTTAHQFICSQINRKNPEFDLDRLIHSTLGKTIADSMRLERDFRRFDDPVLLENYRRRGLKLEAHWTEGERWLSLRPTGADGKLPLLVCMKEVRPSSEFQALTALQFYDGFTELAASGAFMMLFFAMEQPDDNELLTQIIAEAKELFDIDEERVYITGQSHNGYLALEVLRRHPGLFAGIATLNDRHGISSPRYSVDPVKMTDEMVEDFSHLDIPLINICGAIENVFPHTEPGTEGYRNAIDAYHRRLAAFRCPDKSDEEIEAALTGSDRANRINGVPGDRTDIVYTMGFEAYISDVRNLDGNWRLRFVTLENLPHMISPQMAELSWSFLRRFARDSKSGEIKEV